MVVGNLKTKATILILIFTILFLIAGRIWSNERLDFNCGDLKSQKEAQTIFERHDKDIYRLDGDNDGVACENL